jgi:hypothetical protein
MTCFSINILVTLSTLILRLHSSRSRPLLLRLKFTRSLGNFRRLDS